MLKSKFITKTIRSFSKTKCATKGGFLYAVSKNPKRLFFSDGFYSTAVAATIISQLNDDIENFLLISIDRQGAQENHNFALNCGFNVKNIELIKHSQLTNFQDLQHKETYWDEIYYPFLEIRNEIRKNFIYRKLFIYEEGLESYGQLNNLAKHGKKYTSSVEAGYYLFPELLTDENHSKAINLALWKRLLKKLSTIYQLPEIKQGTRNVIYCQSSAYQGTPETDHANTTFFEELIKRKIHIWCRLHPRYDTSLTKYIKERAISDSHAVTILNRDIPIGDMFIARNSDRLLALIGEHGTSLLNATIFNIPVFRLQFTCQRPERFENIASLVDSIPPAETFLKKN